MYETKYPYQQKEILEKKKNITTEEKVEKLRKKYSELKFSASLARKLNDAGNKFSGRSNPSFECLCAIVRAASYWKKYIEEDSFVKLIEAMMISMYEINTAVISTHEDLKSYVGNYAVVKKDAKLPDCVTMIVSLSGRVQIGERGGILENYPQ